MTHADAFPFSCPRSRPAPPGDLGAGPLAQHARTTGVRHRHFRGRAGGDDREPGRPGAMPEATVASGPLLVPLNPQPSTQPKERTAMINPSQFLSRALLADAVFSGVSAVGLTLGA